MKRICTLCPRHCGLEEGQTGACRARGNRGGRIVCLNYGRLTALHLDPIEKKPLARFYPGRPILSVGSFGCNLHCPFCQNHEISMAGEDTTTTTVSPSRLTAEARRWAEQGNIGVAFTYNEPLVGYEYVQDCAALLREAGLRTVLVTNGCFELEPLRPLLALTDAVNIDLKAFTPEFYRSVGGELETVKAAIRAAAGVCHTEVTTLILPGVNDSEEEIDAMAAWLASVDRALPLHITGFFPCYHWQGRQPTAADTVRRLRAVAANHLQYVYTGNL